MSPSMPAASAALITLDMSVWMRKMSGLISGLIVSSVFSSSTLALPFCITMTFNGKKSWTKQASTNEHYLDDSVSLTDSVVELSFDEIIKGVHIPASLEFRLKVLGVDFLTGSFIHLRVHKNIWKERQSLVQNTTAHVCCYGVPLGHIPTRKNLHTRSSL